MDNDSSLTPEGHASGWFAKAIFITAEAFGTKLSEVRVRVYASELSDCDRDQVERAFAQCRREGSGFFPSIPEIRRQLGPSSDDHGVLAWAGLCEAASTIGAYQPLQIDDWCAAEALRRAVGSWVDFCALEEGPNKLVVRQAFLAAYRQARRERQSDAKPQIMLGLCGAPPEDHSSATWGGRLTDQYHVLQTRVADLPALTSGEGGVNRLTEGQTDG